MEQVEQDGVEIDRCTQCHGIWFDGGEMEALRNPEAAKAIDLGDAEEGERQNIKDHYRCPRCNGTMLKVFDPLQRHIWFETCSSCGGSFFDAGEFRDLSEFTFSDILKSLSKPARE
jgi:Zn-finger nucleic acid-binding protein